MGSASCKATRNVKRSKLLNNVHLWLDRARSSWA
jgi:hypothetical protein